MRKRHERTAEGLNPRLKKTRPTKGVAKSDWLIRRFGVLIGLTTLLIGACIPAEVSPILSATPGEAVIVTNNVYENDHFSLTYPTGWRVITSPADAPPGVTLVAPGDCALIVVAAAPVEPPTVPEACTQEDILSETRDLTFDSMTVALAGSAPLSAWGDFLVAFERVAGSVTAQ